MNRKGATPNIECNPYLIYFVHKDNLQPISFPNKIGEKLKAHLITIGLLSKTLTTISKNTLKLSSNFQTGAPHE